MAKAGSTYYRRRSERDPAWREHAIACAGERYRAAKKAGPEKVRDVSRRYRARLRENSLTFQGLSRRWLSKESLIAVTSRQTDG